MKIYYSIRLFHFYYVSHADEPEVAAGKSLFYVMVLKLMRKKYKNKLKIDKAVKEIMYYLLASSCKAHIINVYLALKGILNKTLHLVMYIKQNAYLNWSHQISSTWAMHGLTLCKFSNRNFLVIWIRCRIDGSQFCNSICSGVKLSETDST